MRKGFSLIELVLSIVIIALSVAAVPIIIKRTAENNAYALEQEVIMDAKLYMSFVFQKPWDSQFANSFSNSPIVETNSNCPALKNRVGLVTSNNNGTRAVVEHSKKARSISENKLLEGMDQFRNNKAKIVIDETELRQTNGDLIFTVDISTGVYFVDDSAFCNNQTPNLELVLGKGQTTSTSNIKHIEVKAEIENGDEVVLHSYSTNIGEGSLGRRTFQ